MLKEDFAPIAIFTFIRLQKLKRLINNLKKNKLSKKSEVYIFSDYSLDSKNKILKIRSYLKSIKGFKKINLIFRKKNYGNGKNIIDGINHVLKKRDKVIVLEDDLKIGKNFLYFMNICLSTFKNQRKIWHISGWNFNININNDNDIFFCKLMHCWGWATWKNRWKYFDKNPKKLIEYFKQNKSKIREFNVNGKLSYYNQILKNRDGIINTWAVFWYATIFKNKGLCVTPNDSIVINDGFDYYSTHIHPKHIHNVIYKNKLSNKMKFKIPCKIEEYKDFIPKFEKFFKSKINWKLKGISYLKKIINV